MTNLPWAIVLTLSGRIYVGNLTLDLVTPGFLRLANAFCIDTLPSEIYKFSIARQNQWRKEAFDKPLDLPFTSIEMIKELI